MLATLWTSFRALLAALGLGADPEALSSADSDLGKTMDPDGWSRALQTLLVLLDRLLARGPREMRQAEQEIAEILSLPADERAGRIERARSRFRSPALVRLLLEASQKHIPDQPGEAHQLADLARKVANRNPGMPGYFDLYTLATALQANACRAGGDQIRRTASKDWLAPSGRARSHAFAD